MSAKPTHVRPPYVVDCRAGPVFESCELPCVRWTQSAHLAVRQPLTQRRSFHEATDGREPHIRRFNEFTREPHRVSRYITVLFLRLVAVSCLQCERPDRLVTDLAAVP